VFARSPWYALPAHLRRFGVRAPWSLARGFSWQSRLTHFAALGSDSCLRLELSRSAHRIYLAGALHTYPTSTNAWVGLPSCVTPSLARTTRRSIEHATPKGDLLALSSVWPAWTRPKRYRNINRSSIDYASRPRLRSRLTLGGLTFPRNPWAYGGRVFHPSFATHAGIRTRQASTARFPGRFTRLPTLPYPSTPLHPGSSPPGQKSRHDDVVRMPQLLWCA
jgi:hypothetical protein